MTGDPFVIAFVIPGGVAQLGEHLLCKQGVVGSNPIVSTRGVSAGGWGGLPMGLSREGVWDRLGCLWRRGGFGGPGLRVV